MATTMTAEETVAPVLSVDEHPRVIEIRAQHAVALKARDAAAQELEQLTRDRDSLKDGAIATLVRLGGLKQSAVAGATERADKDITACEQKLETLTARVEQLTLDARGIVQEVVVELKRAAADASHAAVQSVLESLANIDRQIETIGTLRRHGIHPFSTLQLVSGFGAKFRDEAQRRNWR